MKQITEGKSQPVKVTFNTNQSGIFTLKKAVIECTEVVETNAEQPMEVDGTPDQNGDKSPQVEANATPEVGWTGKFTALFSRVCIQPGTCS